MKILCKMSGEEHTLPCPTPNCPLFGDCMAVYQSQFNKPRTNGERVRSMSDEVLSDYIDCPYYVHPDMCINERSCYDCKLEWLKQPAKEDAR